MCCRQTEDVEADDESHVRAAITKTLHQLDAEERQLMFSAPTSRDGWRGWHTMLCQARCTALHLRRGPPNGGETRSSAEKIAAVCAVYIGVRARFV